jgi:hypothetical protein
VVISLVVYNYIPFPLSKMTYVFTLIIKKYMMSFLPSFKAVPQLKQLVAGFPPRRPGFASWQYVGFVVDKAVLGQVFSEYFGFPCQLFHQFFSIVIITRGWHNRPIGGRSAEWTLDSTPTIPI